MAFRKILIANRGEIALRVIRACKELGIKSVAVYSEADRWAHYVSQADESRPIGPPPPGESYLKIDRILEAARKSGADAIHPGFGFLSENATFSEACSHAKIKFIGPRATTMRAIGNKVSARQMAEKLGVPVIPGISRAVTEPEILAFGKKHGWPILLKASGGGGGRGQRVVRAEGEIGRAFRESSREALASFGNGDMFVEKYLERPRHVEIQFLADSHGNAIHLGERECSIQRRHQKLLEESPSVVVDDALRKKMGETALKMVKQAKYENAGTCEFLVDEKRHFYFLEVNARLQVEHPVTEFVTGIDLVKEQIAVASGEKLRLKQDEVQFRGHAIEVRICAEDPLSNFAPSIGEVTGVRFPAGPFVRVDSDLTPGSRVSIYYDSMVAKLIVWAPTRPEAIARMTRALHEFKIVGVQTTIPFHLRLLADKRFREGKFHTTFVDEQAAFKEVRADRALEAALIASVMEFQRQEQRTPKYASPRPLSPWKQAYLP